VERIKDSKLEILRPVKLYRHDLEELVDLFSKTCATVQLFDEEFEYSSLAELEERQGKGALIPYIKIHGFRPNVSLTLGATKISWVMRQQSNHVYGESEDQAELLATRLSSYLSQRKRFLPILFNWYSFLLAVCLQTAVLIANRRKDPNFLRNHSWAMFLEACYYLLLAYTFAFPLVTWGGMSRISLAPKHSDKSFFAEHGYDLFKGILLVTLGVGLKWLFDHFMK
jgi:hypothetical protein